MKLSAAQVQFFWREWPKACKAQCWTKERGFTAADIDAKRKEMLARVGFNSLTEVDRVKGFTRVKNELLILKGKNIQAGIEGHTQHENDKRVLINFIVTDQIPCLELYVEDSMAYMTAILEDKNRWWKIDRPNRQIRLEDLDAKPIFKWDAKTQSMREFPSQLHQIQYTLSARINTFRNESNHTVHEMRTLAGLRCKCSVCIPTLAQDCATQTQPSDVKETQPF